ncbi:MAG: hypothetical protein V3R83_09905 [Gammaproteobacteria bacterium]
MTKNWTNARNPGNLEPGDLRCSYCGKAPEELPEYSLKGQEDYYGSPADFVMKEEGTLDRSTGAFCCTDCYVKIGCPTEPVGWKAPIRSDHVAADDSEDLFE